MKLLKFIGFALLLFISFGMPLLLLAGFDPPKSYRFNDFAQKGLLSVWWGRLLLATYWVVLGWLTFWAIVSRGRYTNQEREASSSGKKYLLGRLKNRPEKSRKGAEKHGA